MCTTRQFVLAVYCRSIQDEVGPSTCLLLFKHIVDLQVQVLYPDKITIIYLENSKATHTCRSRCVTDRRVCFRCLYIAVCDLVTGRRVAVGLVCFRCSPAKSVGKGRQFVLAVMTIEKIFKFKHIIQLNDYYLFGKCNFSLLGIIDIFQDDYNFVLAAHVSLSRVWLGQVCDFGFICSRYN